MVFHSFREFLLDISGHVSPYSVFAYFWGHLVAGIFYRKCTCAGLSAGKTKRNVFSYGTDSLHDAGFGHMGSDAGFIKEDLYMRTRNDADIENYIEELRKKVSDFVNTIDYGKDYTKLTKDEVLSINSVEDMETRFMGTALLDFNLRELQKQTISYLFEDFLRAQNQVRYLEA